MTTHYDPYPQNAAAPVARAYAPPRARLQSMVPAIQPDAPEGRGLRLDGMAVAALIVAAFLIFQTIRDRAGDQQQEIAPKTAGQSAQEIEMAAVDSAPSDAETAEAPAPEAVPLAPPAADPWAITYPYDEYWVTQGPHGYSYGHMAIDLAAGKGEPVKSPIHGEVTANYVDVYGNTTLVIENEIYAVTILHGNYSAQVGQQVALGEVVGSEWNNGYTLDMEGNSCRNRDCGYHSHLNVFSKQSQSNVNPLDVLQ